MAVAFLICQKKRKGKIMNLKFNDPIYPIWNTNDSGEYIESIKINGEVLRIYGSRAFLIQLPDSEYGVRIVDTDGNPLYEVYVSDRTLAENEFRVDYLNGLVTFHPNMTGKIVTVETYYGRGFIMLPSSRVYYRYSSLTPGEIDGTLQEFMDQIQRYIYRGVFNINTQYSANNQVFYNGSTYLCLQDCVGISPDNAAYWRVLAKGLFYAGVWNASATYKSGNNVTSPDGLTMYVALEDNQNIPLTTVGTWAVAVSVKTLYDQLAAAENARVVAENNRVAAESTRVTEFNGIMDDWAIREAQMEFLIAQAQQLTVLWTDV